MKKSVIWIFLIVILPACNETKFQNASNSTASAQALIPMGIVTAVDDQRSEKTGMPGMLPINIRKEALIHSVGNYLIDYIHHETGLRVERIEINETDSIKLVATKNKASGVIILKIRTLEIMSLGESKKSMQADAVFELTVFDEHGAEIYRRTVKEHYEKQTTRQISEQPIMEFAESVVKNTLKQYLKDPDLKRVIARFKYGAIGGVIARIFN